MRIVPVNTLKSDMELAKPVYHNGQTLLNTGVKNLYKYKNKLLNLGIKYLYIEDKYSRDITVNDIIRDETRQNSRKIIKDTFDNIATNNEIDINKIKDIVFTMLNDILNFDEVLVNLLDIKSFDSYTYSHSVNVAAISLLMGKILKYNKENLLLLGTGAILHDVGKIFIPAEIINKAAKLTPEEFKFIKEHSRLGYDFIKDYADISPVARIIILSHHERLDGTGYPKGLVKKEIHQFARVVAIADVFDALTSDRIYRDGWSINETVEYLQSNVNIKFDYKLVELFIRNIAVYPNGTMVFLSNGQKGIVKKQNKNFPLRPIVKLIEDENGNEIINGEEIDLLNELDIVIIDNN